MNAAFRAFLRRLVRRGRLEVATADGAAETFGDGVGPPLGVKLLDGAAERRLMLNPELALGELYMDGRLVLTKGDLYDLLELGARNLAGLADGPWAKALARARLAFRGLHQRNNRTRAKRNVASHYDLDQRLYNLFLDPDIIPLGPLNFIRGPLARYIAKKRTPPVAQSYGQIGRRSPIGILTERDILNSVAKGEDPDAELAAACREAANGVRDGRDARPCRRVGGGAGGVNVARPRGGGVVPRGGRSRRRNRGRPARGGTAVPAAAATVGAARGRRAGGAGRCGYHHHLDVSQSRAVVVGVTRPKPRGHFTTKI